MAAQGTVNVWLGSASQVTSPELSTLINLYSTTLLGVRLTVTAHSGLLVVYADALSAIASSVSQVPRAETFPELHVW